MEEITIHLESGPQLAGFLTVPDPARGLVLFVHGSGSSRLSRRNLYVAGTLNRVGLATLVFDLLTVEEDAHHDNRFDIGMLARRTMAVT